MKKEFKYFVSWDKWTGKLFRIASSPTINTIHKSAVINNDIIDDIIKDKRSLESCFVGIDPITKKYNVFDKNGTIYLPPSEKQFTEIKIGDNKEADVSLELYKNNKLLEVTINYRAVKTWYNHRMKDRFSFAKDYYFIFEIIDKKDNSLIKQIKLSSDRLLETFHTTIDLSDIKKLDNIKILTKRLFQTYNLKIENNKYYSKNDNSKINFTKVDTKKKNIKYDIIINLTNIENTIMIMNNINNLNISKIYNNLEFYITGKDPNELHDILSIPVQTLHDKKHILIKLKCNIDDKMLWSYGDNIKVLFNKKKVIKI